MTKLDEKLQALYQQSKSAQQMPDELKQRLLQLKPQSRPSNWRKIVPVAQAVVASAALIWLTQQLQSQPDYYQIVLQSDDQLHQVQLHQLTNTATSVQQSAYQQRYQQYQQAKQQLEQSNKRLGLLSRSGQHWQIEVCDGVLVKIEQQLAQDLQKDKSWRSGQWVEFNTGQQGQILAVNSGLPYQGCRG